MTEPIFILSMPRSGSTLLQRLVATHPDVATASEPWLLLPLVYSTIEMGVHSEYRHRLAVRAISDFARSIPGGQEAYRDELASLARRLYAQASGNARYFLDKTPRYHLIAQQLSSLFPKAPVIVLWRQPLAVVASIMETWGSGRWNVYDFAVDVELAPVNLVRFAESQNVLEVSYESLARNPRETMQRVFDHLGLDHHMADLESYQDVALSGRYGDQTGMTKYSRLSTDSIGSWPDAFRPFLRRRWAERYLRRLGAPVMARMGYSLEETLAQLTDNRPTAQHLWDDSVRMSYGWLHGRINDFVLRHRAGAIRPGRRKS